MNNRISGNVVNMVKSNEIFMWIKLSVNPSKVLLLPPTTRIMSSLGTSHTSLSLSILGKRLGAFLIMNFSTLSVICFSIRGADATGNEGDIDGEGVGAAGGADV